MIQFDTVLKRDDLCSTDISNYRPGANVTFSFTFLERIADMNFILLSIFSNRVSGGLFNRYALSSFLSKRRGRTGGGYEENGGREGGRESGRIGSSGVPDNSMLFCIVL